ncbi:MAG: HlyD family efflux transporter periplasmic adaptor subunit [Rhodoferax sp.]|nr:HlyD family efflux transporter periplasmic adaptor subunit [Rhodoferax sp.]
MFTWLWPAEWTSRLVLMMVAMLIAVVLWMHYTTIPQLSRSPGQVIAMQRTQIIQAANDGVVESIPIKEGDSVKKGQLLMQLDASQAEAAVRDSAGRVAALKATLARLQAEVFQRPLEFDSSLNAYPIFIKNQRDLYERRQRAFTEEISTLRTMLGDVEKELEMSQPLLATGDIAQTEVLRLRRSKSELEGTMTNRQNKFFQDAQADMTKVEEDLSTQQQVLVDRTTNLERMQMFAPSDGLVRNLRMTTLGGRVRPGDVVMELFPTSSELIVEGKLKPSDLNHVVPGQAATVKLDSFDYSIYGILDGKVSYVSPDALSEAVAGQEHIYYRVHVTIDKEQMPSATHKKIAINPGMTAQIEIRTGQMSVLSYLIKPLVKTISSSFSER